MADILKTIRITGNDLGANSLFGTSVSLNSAGNIAIIGARGHSVTGAAYIFTGDGNNWIQTVKLTGSDSNGEDYFGASVAINSDGNIVAIGASQAETFGIGSVYIFTGSGSNWNQTAKITGSGTLSVGPLGQQIGDGFGNSIAINSIGDTILVGAQAISSTGSAHIFTGSGYNWIQTARLTGSDSIIFNQFGASVSLNSAGNVALVGANSGVGAAYIFTGSGDNWIQTARLTGSDAIGVRYFGNSVDLNSEGNIALVGAYGYNRGVYIFSGSGANWVEIKKITGGSNIDDAFGFSVSLNGVGNIAVVGGLQYSISNGVYIFTGNNNNWTQTGHITGNVDTFGYSTSINKSGDIILVGALAADVNTIDDAGSAYIFTGFIGSQISSSSSSSSSFNYFEFNDIYCHGLPSFITGLNYVLPTGTKDKIFIDLNAIVSGFYNKS